MMFNKEFLAWLCGMISSDGHVGCYFLTNPRNQKKYKGGNVTISSSDEVWAKTIVHILETNGLSCHILQTHKERQERFGGKRKPEFNIDIHKYNPPRKRSGTNQWLVILDGIIYYHLEEYMMPRKLVILAKIALLR